MPRKGPAPKRPVVADPVYGAQVVSQLVNKILLDGKKDLAQRIVYGALDGVAQKSGQDAVQVLKKALDNVPREHPRASLADQLRQVAS